MSTLDEILKHPTGATFYRADLHIHSYGASHDVRDASMAPKGIIATALREGLAMIAVTDHNEIENIAETIREGTTVGIYVVPGVELSTSQGHLLCYAPTLDALTKFYSSLTLVDRGTQTSRCQQSLIECLTLIQRQNGFGILAHVDATSGFELEYPGASPHKVDVICHPALLGIELRARPEITDSPIPGRIEVGYATAHDRFARDQSPFFCGGPASQ